MKIATFNVNSIRARLPVLTDWLSLATPDVVLIQETKCEDAFFPEAELQQLGYNCAYHGQKSYNGVAILAKCAINNVLMGLPGDPADEQARYIEADIGNLRLASIYLPNGNPVPSDKYHYKLQWMDRLRQHIITQLLPLERPVLLGGDYNICPEDRDLYDPQGWAEDALCRPESRRAFRALLHAGLTEAWRSLNPDAAGIYSYWDYVKGRRQRDEGLRIDHFLLSPQAADLLNSCEIDTRPRDWEKASDHTPVVCRLDID